MNRERLKESSPALLALGLLTGSYLGFFVFILVDIGSSNCWLERNMSSRWERRLETLHLPLIVLIQAVNADKFFRGRC